MPTSLKRKFLPSRIFVWISLTAITTVALFLISSVHAAKSGSTQAATFTLEQIKSYPFQMS
jgi:hypothetical protein